MNKKQEEFLRTSAAKSDTFEKRLENAGFELATLANLSSSKKYRLILLEPLQSLFLNNVSKFRQLRTVLENWNEEIKRSISANQEIENGMWRESLMTNLAIMLKEVVITTERQTQRLYLDQVHKWFYQTLNKGRSSARAELSTEGSLMSKTTSSMMSKTASSFQHNRSELVHDSIVETPLLKGHRRNESDGVILSAASHRRIASSLDSSSNIISRPDSGGGFIEGKTFLTNWATSSNFFAGASTSSNDLPQNYSTIFSTGGLSRPGTSYTTGPGGEVIQYNERSHLFQKPLKKMEKRIVSLNKNDFLSNIVITRSTELRPSTSDSNLETALGKKKKESQIFEEILESGEKDEELMERIEWIRKKQLEFNRNRGPLLGLGRDPYEWAMKKTRLEEETSRKMDSGTFGSFYEDLNFKRTPLALQSITEKDDKYLETLLSLDSGLNESSQSPNKLTSEEIYKAKNEGLNYGTRASAIRVNPFAESAYGRRVSIQDVVNIERKNNWRRNSGVIKNQSSNSLSSITVDFSKTMRSLEKKQQPKEFENFPPFEAQSREEKRQKIKRFYQRNIRMNIPPIEGAEETGKYTASNSVDLSARATPLSVYDPERFGSKKREPEVAGRPLSKVFRLNNREKIFKDQFGEVEEVKRNLARYKIVLPTNKLVRALMIPEYNHKHIQQDEEAAIQLKLRRAKEAAELASAKKKKRK